MFSGSTVLTEAVARGYARVLAYKDEYEVARLYRAPAFRAALDAQFDGARKLRFHLAPPIMARRDPRTGHLRKREFGPWMMGAFAVMAPLKVLRGTALDPFGRTEERRAERALIGQYEADVAELLASLLPRTLAALWRWRRGRSGCGATVTSRSGRCGWRGKRGCGCWSGCTRRR